MMTERDDADELVASARPDLLRAAFAQALGEIMRLLPPGVERDIAMTEVLEAHARAMITTA
jgi:hypothetical protein